MINIENEEPTASKGHDPRSVDSDENVSFAFSNNPTTSQKIKKKQQILSKLNKMK